MQLIQSKKWRGDSGFALEQTGAGVDIGLKKSGLIDPPARSRHLAFAEHHTGAAILAFPRIEPEDREDPFLQVTFPKDSVDPAAPTMLAVEQTSGICRCDELSAES